MIDRRGPGWYVRRHAICARLFECLTRTRHRHDRRNRGAERQRRAARRSSEPGISRSRRAASEHVEDSATSATRSRHRSEVIERRAERDDAFARDLADRRLEPDRAARGRRDADRPAGVGAERAEAHAGRRGRRRRRRSIRRPIGIGSIGLRTRPEGDSSLVVPNANSWRLVLPMMIAPSRPEFGDGRCVSVRLDRGQGRPRRRPCAGDVDQVLDASTGMPCRGPR